MDWYINWCYCKWTDILTDAIVNGLILTDDILTDAIVIGPIY